MSKKSYTSVSRGRRWGSISKSRGGGFKLEATLLQGPHRSRYDVRRQGVGGYPKKWKFGATSFMDGPLRFDIFFAVLM